MTNALLQGLIAGATYALLALGFGLTYFTTGIFHFAHGAVYAAAAYVAWWLFDRQGWGLPGAAAAGVAVAAWLGWVVEAWLYRPLRERRAPLDVQFLTSLGVFTVATNVFGLAFGYQAQVFSRLANPAAVLRAGAPGRPPVVVTAVQGATLLAAVAVFVGLWLAFRLTRFGLALRAWAANPELAEVLGVDGRRLLPRVVALGSALGGVAAICVGVDVGVTPEMGLTAVVIGAVAVVAGGVGSLPGTAIAGLALGILQHLVRYRIGARWEEAVTFALLLVILLVRPQGLFGKRR